MTTLNARIDDFGRPAWIAQMVLGFIVFWPIGLIILGFLIGSGRMGCWSHNGGHWGRHGGDRWQWRIDRMQRGVDRMQEGLQRMQEKANRWRDSFQQQPAYQAASSGNRAFDEYREETLRRLADQPPQLLAVPPRPAH